MLFAGTAWAGPIPVEAHDAGDRIEIWLVDEKSAVRQPPRSVRCSGHERTHHVSMVRLNKHAPARAECASQGLERGYIFLLRSIPKRSEDIASDIETGLLEGLAKIMPE